MASSPDPTLAWNDDTAQRFQSMDDLVPQTDVAQIAFAVNVPLMLGHYASILDHLPEDRRVVLNFATDLDQARQIQAWCERAGYRHYSVYEVMKACLRFQVLVSHVPFCYVAPPFFPNPGVNYFVMFRHLSRTQVRMMYGLGKDLWNFGQYNGEYDAVLVYGPYQEEQLRQRVSTPVYQVGYPRFDGVKNGSVQGAEVRARLGLSSERKSLVWLPTCGDLCSIPRFLEPIAALGEDYNLILKPHPLTDPAILGPVRQVDGLVLLDAPDYDNAELFALADWVIADYGGSPFGALYSNTNLLLLNMPGAAGHQTMSAESPDQMLRQHFVNLDSATPEALCRIFNDPDIARAQQQARAILNARFFLDTQGQAGRVAAQRLLEILQRVEVSAP